MGHKEQRAAVCVGHPRASRKAHGNTLPSARATRHPRITRPTRRREPPERFVIHCVITAQSLQAHPDEVRLRATLISTRLWLNFGIVPSSEVIAIPTDAAENAWVNSCLPRPAGAARAAPRLPAPSRRPCQLSPSNIGGSVTAEGTTPARPRYSNVEARPSAAARHREITAMPAAVSPSAKLSQPEPASPKPASGSAAFPRAAPSIDDPRRTPHPATHPAPILRSRPDVQMTHGESASSDLRTTPHADRDCTGIGACRHEEGRLQPAPIPDPIPAACSSQPAPIVGPAVCLSAI